MEALKRRRTGAKSAKTRWSDKMSPEAQIAMQLAIEDTKALKLEEEARAKQAEELQRSPTRVAFADEKRPNGSAHPSFHEIYERNGSARMRRDLTDEEYSEDSEPKKALGGGKVESAMEIVEIVNHDGPAAGGALDEEAIEELARINSVDKCTVWIEATQTHQDQPGGAGEGTAAKGDANTNTANPDTTSTDEKTNAAENGNTMTTEATVSQNDTKDAAETPETKTQPNESTEEGDKPPSDAQTS